MAEQRWIPETLFEPQGFRMTYAVEQVLYEQQTEHQHLVLFEHRFFGKMLMLDGATQVTAKDEFVYHEMMTHVPILAHGKARDILIIGGGDCGIAEEVLKHKSVKRLTQVEIDASVIEFAKEHFPEFTGPVFSDKRFESVIGDGMKYVAETDRRFDVIIVDSTDPQGPGAVLFTEEFYAGCKRCLNKGGILVTQNGVPVLQPDELTTTVGQLPAAVQGRHLLRRGDPDLCRRPHGDGLCQRRQGAAPDSGSDDRGALPEGRAVPDQVLDAGRAQGRLRAAALHRGAGGEGEALAPASPSIHWPRAEQPLRVAVGDVARLLGRKLREPGAVVLEDRVVAEPALVDPGVGADQEAVGMAREQVAPFARELARAVGDAAAVGQLAPQRRILLEQLVARAPARSRSRCAPR